MITVLAELGCLIIELYDLSGADESEVKRVSEQHHIFTFVVLEGNILELINIPSCAFEIRGWELYSSLGDIRPLIMRTAFPGLIILIALVMMESERGLGQHRVTLGD